MNPPRAGYFRSVLERELGPAFRRREILDVGCGGGLLTEELLRAGIRVTGIDIAERALRIARDHARQQGLDPRYARGRAEELPFADGSFAAVVSSDFLEHVDSLDAVVGECARVLESGGIFLFDTINRTWLTRVFHIGLLQEWRNLVPPHTHDWRQFIRPFELAGVLRRAGLAPVETRGLTPVHPIRFGLHLMIHRKGKDRMPPFHVSDSISGSYLGYAVKQGEVTTYSRTISE